MLRRQPFCCALPSRALIRIVGNESHNFLQGLFTNDLRLLRPGGSMWGCFLFYTGRVFCDAYLYQSQCKNCDINNQNCKISNNCSGNTNDQSSMVYVDVHVEYVNKLLDYLTEMKMRKKITIDNITGTHSVFAVHSSFHCKPVGSDRIQNSVNCTPSTLSVPQAQWFDDPRSFALQDNSDNAAKKCSSKSTIQSVVPTLRKVIVPSAAMWNQKQNEEKCKQSREVCIIGSEQQYNKLLMRNGIGEGPSVFKQNKTLPFEANTDFLKGVSFHKGCYVGQELTHRTHVMLVTRKRIVPIQFTTKMKKKTQIVSEYMDEQQNFGDVHINETCCAKVGDALYTRLAGHNDLQKVGEVAAVCDNLGLGLVRLRYVDSVTRQIDPLELQNGTQVQISIPHWWPQKKIRKLLKPIDVNKEGLS